MRSSRAARLAASTAFLGLVAGCSSAGSGDPGPEPTPTPETAGWEVYEGPPAPDLVLRQVPLAAGVPRGLDEVERVERVGGVAVIWGREDLEERMKAVDLASGRVLWQYRSGQSVASALGEVELRGGWEAVPAAGVLVTTSYLEGCVLNDRACGVDPRLEQGGDALHAVDVRTGEVRWSVPLLPAAPESDAGDLPFGVDAIEPTGSVVVANLVDDRGEAALVQGYDAATGRRLWERSGAWVFATADDLALTHAIDDPDEGGERGALQGRDARTGKVRWTNPDLPFDEFPDATGSADDGMGKAGNTFFSLANGRVVARSTQYALLASGTDGVYGATGGPSLDERQCCIKTVATVGPDGVWRRSEQAVGQSVEWADGDYVWRSLDTSGEGLVAVDRTGAARSPELPVTYGAQFAPGLILSEEYDDGIRIWTYRARRSATAGEG